jgi:hypothetical protein
MAATSNPVPQSKPLQGRGGAQGATTQAAWANVKVEQPSSPEIIPRPHPALVPLNDSAPEVIHQPTTKALPPSSAGVKAEHGDSSRQGQAGNSNYMPPPPFLTKTYDMVDDPSTDAIVSWGAGNNRLAFILKNACANEHCYLNHAVHLLSNPVAVSNAANSC